MMDTHNLQFAAFLCWLYAALLASVKQKRLKAVWEIGIWESLITKHKSRPKELFLFCINDTISQDQSKFLPSLPCWLLACYRKDIRNY